MHILKHAAGAGILLAASAAALMGLHANGLFETSSGHDADRGSAEPAVAASSSPAFRALAAGGIAPVYSMISAWSSPGVILRVAAGDFDGGGRQDLAALVESPDTGNIVVHIYLQNGAGQLGVPWIGAFPVDLAGGWIQGLTAVDLNEDGRSDLVVTQRRDIGMYYALALPGGGFEWHEDEWTNRIHSGPVRTGDMDGDGHVDLVAHVGFEFGSGQIVVYYGDGLGKLFRHSSSPSRDDKARVAVGQLEGSVAPDVLSVGGTYYEYSPHVWRNEGSGTLAAPRSLLARWQDAYADAFVADFTGDGVPDAAAAGWANAASRLVVYPRLPNGTLSSQPTLHALSTTSGLPGPMTVADLDGNGMPDVLQLDRASQLPRFFISFQDAYGLGYPREIPFDVGSSSAQFYATDIAAGDFNNDGVTDVVVSTGGHGVQLLLGQLTPYTGAGGLPGPPTVLLAVDGAPGDNLENARAAVTIAASANDGGTPITGYTVFTVGGGGYDLDAGDPAGTHTVAGLEQGKSYTFVARATNAAGMGPPSAASAPLAIGVPVDPNALPKLYISTNDSLIEGDIGRSHFWVYGVLDKPAPAGGISYDIASVNGSAIAGIDFDGVPTTHITIPEFQMGGRLFQIATIGDTLVEGNELWYLDVTNALGMDPEGSIHTPMSVVDDGDGGDARLSVATVDIVEGNAGSQVVNVAVLLSKPLATDVVFDIETRLFGQAIPNEDYDPFVITGFHLPAGQTQALFPVTIHGDTMFEGVDTVVVGLSNVQGEASWSPWPLEGGVRIINDEPTPTLSIADVEIEEGDQGTSNVVFKAKLSAPLPYVLELSAVTIEGTAREGRDYLPQYVWNLTMQPGETELSIPIAILTDRLYENNESFSLRIEDVYGAPVTDAVAVATLQNDDPPPQVRVGDVSVPEGQTAQAFFQLDGPSGLPMTLSVRTAPGTAAPGIDYLPAQSTNLVIPAGATVATLAIQTVQDTTVEDNETFVVEIAGATGGTVADAQGLVRIVNDDLAVFDLLDASVQEGNFDLAPAVFEVRLSAPMPTATIFDIAVVPGGTAQAGDRVARTIVGARIDAGRTRYIFQVLVAGDTIVEGNETFVVRVTGLSGATLQDDTGIGTIIDDDSAARPAGASVRASRPRLVTVRTKPGAAERD